MKYQIIRQWINCKTLNEEVWLEETESLAKAHYLDHCASRAPITFTQDGDYVPDVFFVRKVD